MRALDRLAAGDRDDDRQREDMALASLEAGMAFSNAVLGAVHAMSHPVGGRYDASHGEINGVLLAHVVDYNSSVMPRDRLEDLARASGVTVGAGAARNADRVAERFRRLTESIGLPTGLSALGVRAEDVPVLATHAVADLCMATNPRPVDVETVARLYREAS